MGQEGIEHAMNTDSITFKRTSKLFAAVALAFATGLGSSSIVENLHAQPQDGQATRQSPAAPEHLKHALALSEAFKEVARSVSPSVVHIRSTQQIATTSGSLQLQPGPINPFDDEFFRRFFGDDIPGFRSIPNLPQIPQERVGQGTGVIASADGYIITNNHVVDGATEIKVRLADDSEYDAEVVGTDVDTDLALIKIDASGLTPATFGDSDALEVGEWVVAIGSPFGLQKTVTAGIVSAKGRTGMNLATFEDFIQTDAAINPGNSGGPLVNLYGEVVGINTAISTRSGGYQGVGFAIPSNMVKRVFDSLSENGMVRRGALGVQIAPLTEQASEYYGFEGTSGVLIADVYPDSGAAKAGIRVGDIVTHIDGRPTPDNRTLLNMVAERAPGETVTLTVFRDGRAQDIQVTLGDRATQFAQLTGRNAPGASARQPGAANLGLTVQELTPELAQQLNAQDRSGVVVSRVAPNSLAAKADIARGDIIAQVDGVAVSNIEEFNQAMQKADLSRGVSLQVIRNGLARIVILRNADK